MLRNGGDRHLRQIPDAIDAQRGQLCAAIDSRGDVAIV
jgi:hypothetical protein